jgi:hypothetical protein
MGVALFIVAERTVEGLDTFVDGKALARCRPAGAKERLGRASMRHLETLARQAGVWPLMEFFSEDPKSAYALIAEEGEEPPDDLPPEQWFSAAEGLATIRGLLAYLTTHPDAAAEVDRLIEDLRQFEEVLSRLEEEGIRWHLAVDF